MKKYLLKIMITKNLTHLYLLKVQDFVCKIRMDNRKKFVTIKTVKLWNLTWIFKIFQIYKRYKFLKFYKIELIILNWILT